MALVLGSPAEPAVIELDPADRPIGRLLRAQQTTNPDSIVEVLAAAAAGIGGTDVVLYFIDHELLVLTPYLDLPTDGEPPEPARVEGTLAGRAFTSAQPLAVEHDDRWRVWVPVIERANRIGVLSMTLPRWGEDVEYFCAELGFAAAHLVMASAQYSDLPHLLRRRKDMDLAAEMQWSLLPPLSFATAETAVAGLLEPAYEVGGDCFDYALNGRQLDLAVFDAVGHGLGSAVIASLLMGAYRHSRREHAGLREMAADIDAAVRTLPGKVVFATALLGRLDTATGRLTWITCGHPQPIFVRRGSRLPKVEVVSGLPLGLGALGGRVAEVVETDLEPGDGVLFYTDGVVEARDHDGIEFGEDRLSDLLIREHLTRDSPQEVVRRLVRSAVRHSKARIRDDASLLYLRWNPRSDEPSGT